MNELRESFIRFWEILTGVFNDDRSKLLRIVSFVMLFLGCVWSGFNYLKAAKISDLSEEIENSSLSQNVRGRNEAIDKLMTDARTVGTMRRGGRSIANALDKMHTSPFNIDEAKELGIDNLPQDIIPAAMPATPEFALDDIPEPEEIRKPLIIKALMISGKNRYAVVDYDNSKGSVVHQGQVLPDGARVVKITQEGVTLKNDGREFVYLVK